MTRRKTPGSDNFDNFVWVRHIEQSLFSRVEAFPNEDRSSCTVRCGKLFTLENLNRRGRRLKAVDTIQAVVDTATKLKRGTGKRKGFSALISIDIRNVFKSARRKVYIESMMCKKIPYHLLQMIDNYLSDK